MDVPPLPLCHPQDEKNKNTSFVSHSSTIISGGDTCFKETRTSTPPTTTSTAPREASSPWSPERDLTLAQPKFLGNHRRALRHPLGHSRFWSTEAADEQHMSLWSQISSKTDVERKILFRTKALQTLFLSSPSKQGNGTLLKLWAEHFWMLKLNSPPAHAGG